jgi:hypothetical protein
LLSIARVGMGEYERSDKGAWIQHLSKGCLAVNICKNLVSLPIDESSLRLVSEPTGE